MPGIYTSYINNREDHSAKTSIFLAKNFFIHPQTRRKAVRNQSDGNSARRLAAAASPEISRIFNSHAATFLAISTAQHLRHSPQTPVPAILKTGGPDASHI
jgi:hypothetical protein